MASAVSLETSQILDAIHYLPLLPAENEAVGFLFGGFLFMRPDLSLV